MSWLIENGIALYGAITGTVALAITFISHRHSVKKDQIKLAVSYSEHPKKSENIERLNTKHSDQPWEQPHIVEVYVVTVRNLGSIPAPLHDVGVMDKAGKRYQVLVGRRSSQFNILQPIPECNVEPLEPRSARTFSVYLHRDETIFMPEYAYAIDQTGKEWRAHA